MTLSRKRSPRRRTSSELSHWIVAEVSARYRLSPSRRATNQAGDEADMATLAEVEGVVIAVTEAVVGMAEVEVVEEETEGLSRY